jgi:hypothetical protein
VSPLLSISSAEECSELTWLPLRHIQVSWFNRYAYIEIALYGKAYVRLLLPVQSLLSKLIPSSSLVS